MGNPKDRTASFKKSGIYEIDCIYCKKRITAEELLENAKANICEYKIKCGTSYFKYHHILNNAEE